MDNGSEDGTQEWLKEKGYNTILNKENKGISISSNQALDYLREIGEFDLIIKMDNDCMVKYPEIIERIVRIYKEMPQFKKMMLSPRVEGITNQPNRYSKTMVDNCEIGLTGIIGGLFHVLPGEIYQQFRYNEELPKAWGQDETICNWFLKNGGQMGYIEPISVEHYHTTDGQAKKYPEYFERKWQEEK